MNYKIEDRIDYILEKDKISTPQRICEILKDEIKPIIENYLYLESEVVVRFKKEGNKNRFWIEFDISRIKPVCYIPY